MQAGSAAAPVVATKLHRPAVTPDFVDRPSLTTLLEANTTVPLMLVSAPAGYGKSTLVSNWLSKADRPVAWLSLDEADNDPRLFLTYCVAALRTLVPDAAANTWKLSRSGKLPSVDTMAAVLSNDLDELDERVVLVLDDYHRIREAAIHSLLDQLLEHPSPHLCLVIVSRRDPPISLATLRAKGKMCELRLADLMFVRNETEAFLSATIEHELNVEAVDRLHEMTEGWPVALRLATVALRNRERLEGLLAVPELDSRSLRTFLVSEVLAVQTAEVRKCLLATAILDRFCAPLCEALWAELHDVEVGGEEFIDILQASGLFCVPLDAEGRWFRYHHLFADMLRGQLSEESEESEIAALHQAAAGWFDENGFIEEAIDHAMLAEDLSLAVSLLGSARQQLMSNDEWPRLERLFNRFPKEAQDQYPELILLRHWLQLNLWYALDELAGEMLQGDSLRTIGAEGGEDEALRRAEHAALLCAIQYTLLDSEAAIASADISLAGLPADFECVLSTTILMKGGAILQFEGPQVAGRFFQDHLRNTRFRYPASKARLLQGLCFVHLSAAETHDLRLQANRMLKLTQEERLGWAEGFAHYFLGAAAYDSNQLDEAVALLSPVVSEPYFHGFQHHEFCGALLSLCYTARGEHEEADEILSEIVGAALEADNPRIFELCEGIQAMQSLRRGKTALATTWLNRFEPVLRQYRTRLPDAEVIAGHCMVAMTPRYSDQSKGYLQELMAVLRELHHQRLLLEVLGLLAKVAEDEKDPELAQRYLLEAVDIGFQGDLVRPLADLGEWVVGMLNRLSLADEKLAYVGRIIAVSPFGGAAPERVTADSTAARQDVLSQREREILSLFAENLTNKEIGDQLFISPGTVKRHAHNIYSKLAVAGRREAVAKATGLGLL